MGLAKISLFPIVITFAKIPQSVLGPTVLNYYIDEFDDFLLGLNCKMKHSKQNIP